jgi:AcrR family transcriptional regulator
MTDQGEMSELEAELRAAMTEIERAMRSAGEAASAATEAGKAAGNAGKAAGQAGKAAGQATATASVVFGESAKAALRRAIADAREALAETRIEIKVERLTREESRQRTRERLLDAAAEVFNRLGYHGASLEAVAEAAGYTKGAVYSNFATKGELFAALLRRYTDQRLATQREILERASLDELADAAGAILERQRTEQGSWDLLQVEFWLAAMRDPELLAMLAEGTDQRYRDSGELIDRKLAEGGLTSQFSGYELARLINALGSGLLLQVYVDPDKVDPAMYGRAIRVLVGLAPAS